MNKQFRYRQFKVGSPLTHALVVIVGIIVIALSLALGFFVFIGFGGFILVMTAVFAVRNWWYRRRFAGRDDEGIRYTFPHSEKNRKALPSCWSGAVDEGRRAVEVLLDLHF